MPRRLAVFLGLFVVLAFLAWWILPNSRRQQAVANQLTKAATEKSAATKSRSPAASSPRPSPAETAFPLNAASSDIRADLRLLAETLDTFRSNFPANGNPTGTNAEITAALAGNNKVRFAFIPPNHPAINAHGELCDRWGTPFFFHAESASRMEIRSAGPDKKMWTEDDVAFAP